MCDKVNGSKVKPEVQGCCYMKYGSDDEIEIGGQGKPD